MRWHDIDTEERIWTLPAEMTKVGRWHVVPLSRLAMKILFGLPRADQQPLCVFKPQERANRGLQQGKASAGFADDCQRRYRILDDP